MSTTPIDPSSSENLPITENIYTEDNPVEPPNILKEGIIYFRPPVDCAAPPLTKDQYEEAKKMLIKSDFLKYKFPRVIRNRKDPPINGQVYVLHTFIPSPDAKPDKDGCFGILKIRGSFPNMNEADENAERLIRTVDSYNEIFYGYVGQEFPLTLRSDYCKDTKEVDLKTKLDDIAMNNLKKKREKDQKDLEDIQEREQKLLAESKADKVMSKNDCEFYTTMRVKFATLCHTIEDLEKRHRETCALANKCRNEIIELNKEHPTFQNEYLSRYTSALESSGIKLSDNPLVKYMNETALEKEFVSVVSH